MVYVLHLFFPLFIFIPILSDLLIFIPLLIILVVLTGRE
jgi:hypothetical protein